MGRVRSGQQALNRATFVSSPDGGETFELNGEPITLGGGSAVLAYDGADWPVRPAGTDPRIWSGPLAAGRPPTAATTDLVFLYTP